MAYKLKTRYTLKLLIFVRFNFRETKFSREFIFAIDVLKYFARTYFREFREFPIFVLFCEYKISRISRNGNKVFYTNKAKNRRNCISLIYFDEILLGEAPVTHRCKECSFISSYRQ